MVRYANAKKYKCQEMWGDAKVQKMGKNLFIYIPVARARRADIEKGTRVHYKIESTGQVEEPMRSWNNGSNKGRVGQPKQSRVGEGKSPDRVQKQREVPVSERKPGDFREAFDFGEQGEVLSFED